MADLSDVMNQIVGMTATAVYPNGTANPSVANVGVKVYAGWPVPNVLEADLAQGKAHVSVYSLATERKTSRHIGRPWQVAQDPVTTITATISGTSATLAGTITTPQNVGLNVNKKAYIHAVQATDTPTSIATALATLIQVDHPLASSNANTVTIPDANSVSFIVGGFAKMVRELKRQEKQFQVTVWASTPTIRDQIGSAVDSALASVSDLTFADGSHGIMLYARTFQTDQMEKSMLYRRDIVYSVDYATTQTSNAAQVIAPILNIKGS
ncbi:hypothetical protein [Acinetobacter sp. ANC 4640]